MNQCFLEWKSLDPRAKEPTVGTAGEDLGYDLYSIEYVTLFSGQMMTVRTGVAATAYKGILPSTRLGMLYRDRSSMAKKGITVSGGVIDAGYTGELVVMLTNHSDTAYQIQEGDKIVQMVPQEVLTGYTIRVDELAPSERGGKGFGSSGR